MTHKSLQIEQADPGSLRPNPWNVNTVDSVNEEKISASIQRLGYFKPIIIRTLADGTKQILAGEHRVRAALRAGGAAVPVLDLGQIDDEKAKEISLVDNARYGTDDALRLSELLKTLGSEDELASFLPYSEAEFASIFATDSIDLDELDLPDDVEDNVDIPVPKVQTHQVMRFKVPIADADGVTNIIEAIMKTQGYTEADSLTNAGDALVFLANKYREILEND